MITKFVSFVLPLLFLCNAAIAQKLTSDIPYVEKGHKRHVLDIYTPEEPTKAYVKRDSNHSRLNNDLGKPGDPATQELYKFLEPLVRQGQ
jgi:hypothetical protein